jgi:hypothetical protein
MVKSLSAFLPRLMLALLAAASARADLILPYSDPAVVGNQNYTGGNLSYVFAVNTPVTVYALGVFDSGQDGIAGTLNVAIFKDDGTQETPALSFTGNQGTLIGGDRFQNLATPVVLGIGTYSMTTTGWNDLDLDGNRVAGGTYTPPALNDAGGRLTLEDIGYGDGGLVYLGPSGYPNDTFNIGGFAIDDPLGVPEPGSAAAMTLGLLAIALSRYRRNTSRT